MRKGRKDDVPILSMLSVRGIQESSIEGGPPMPSGQVLALNDNSSVLRNALEDAKPDHA